MSTLDQQGFTANLRRTDGETLIPLVKERIMRVVDGLGTLGDLFSGVVADTFLAGESGEQLASEVDGNPEWAADLDLLQDRLLDEYTFDLKQARTEAMAAMAAASRARRAAAKAICWEGV